MAPKKIEVFSAGCPLCHQAIDLVRRQAGSSCEIIVHNMTDARGFGRATALGVRAVPAVAIDGKLVSSSRGIDIQTLRDVGLGEATTPTQLVYRIEWPKQQKTTSKRRWPPPDS
jgi:glutaredoxin 3